jgi:IS5 family transposase
MFTGLKVQNDFSGFFINEIISENHELVKLKEFLNWDEINKIYRSSFPKAKNNDRPGTSCKHTDLAVGLILLKHLYKMSDRALVKAVHENLAFMIFCGVTPQDIQKARAEGKKGIIEHTAIVKIRKRLGKKNLIRIERMFFQQILAKKLIKGKTLVVDTTSLEKKMLYPTEVSLIKRVIEHAEMVVQKVELKKEMIKSAVIRTANKLAKTYYSAQKKSTELLHSVSRKMIELAKETMKKAGQSFADAKTRRNKVIEKTYRKVKEVGGKILSQIETKLAGEPVTDKIVSYYEPHVRALPKGKIHKPCEFGTKVTLGMSGNGFVTDYDLHEGNPNEKGLLPAMVERHAKEFGSEFQEVTADAEFADMQQNQMLEDLHDVTVAIPDKKSRSTDRGLDKRRKKIYNKRSAIEAKISETKRMYGLDKSDYEGFEGDWTCLILGVFAVNAKKLLRILSPPLVYSR